MEGLEYWNWEDEGLEGGKGAMEILLLWWLCVIEGPGGWGGGAHLHEAVEKLILDMWI